MNSGSASDGGGLSPHSGGAKSAENGLEQSLHTNSSSKTSMSSAFKASGALARLGKAIYSGGSALAIGGATRNETGLFSSDQTISHFVQKTRELTYKAKSGIISMCQSDDREHVAVAGHDFLEVVRVEPDKIEYERDLRSHKTRLFDKIYTVTDLKWGHNQYSNLIALGTSGGDIFLYNSEQEGTPKYRMNVLNRAVNSIAFSSRSSNQLLSGSQDGVVRLWDLRQGSKPVIQFNKTGDNAREVQFKPSDNRSFAVIYYSGVIQKWDIRNAHVPDMKINAHAGNGLTIDWHPELDYIASGGRDRQIQIWNLSLDHREPEYVIRAPNSVSRVRWQYCETRPRSILHSTIANAGGRQDFNTYIWNISRPYIPLYVLEAHDDMITEIQYVNSDVVRTTSKDSYLIQHDLSSEPRLVDNLPTQAIDWMDCQDLTFVCQKKDPETKFLPKSRASSSAISEESHGLSAQHSEEQIWRRPRRPGSVSAPDSHHSTRPSSSRASYSVLPPVEVNRLVDQEFICDVSLPTDDKEAFSYLGNEYRLRVNPGDSLSETCLANVSVAAAALKFRTSNTWKILAEAIKREERDFENYMKRGDFDSPDSRRLSLDGHIGFSPDGRLYLETDKRVLEARRLSPQVSRSFGGATTAFGGARPPFGINRPSTDTNKRSADEHVSLLSEEIKKFSPPDQLEGLKDPEKSTDIRSADFRSFDTKSTDISSLETHATSSAVPIKNSLNKNRMMNTFENKSFTLNSQNLSENSASPDDTYGQARGLGGQSFTQLAMENSSQGSESKDHLRGMSFSTIGSSGMDRRPSYGAMSTGSDHRSSYGTELRPSFDALSDISTKMNEKLSIIEDEPNEEGGDESDGDGESDGGGSEGSDVDDLSDLNNPNDLKFHFRDYLNTLTHAWRAEMLIEKSIEFALAQGDVQYLVTITSLTKDIYKKAFPPLKQIQEWYDLYIELLCRSCEFVAAAKVLKETDMGIIRQKQLKETEFEILCGKCENPLKEMDKNGQNKYRYCPSCHNTLNGCILCNEPIINRAVLFFECGHTFHMECLKSWVEEGMKVCPGGCDTVIA